MLNQSKLWAVALLIATFAAGAVAGGVVAAALGDEPGERHRPRGRMSYAERLERELGLSAAQRESLDAILARRQQAMGELWRQVEPRFDSLRAQIRTEITAILDSDQRAAFQALIARSDSVKAAHHRRHEDKRGR